MKTKSLALGAVLALAIAAPASALTYVTQLDWTDDGGHVTSKGTVTATEKGDNKTVRITVDLDQDADLLIDTGGHWGFTWNLTNLVGNEVTLITTAGPNPYDYQETGGPFFQTGAFGDFTNAFACCGPGQNNGKTSLVFDIFNDAGLTFAGVGAKFNADGSIKTYGSGNQFKSNDTGTAGGKLGGWWFAADIFDAPGGTGPGATYLVAGRDALCDGDGCEPEQPPCQVNCNPDPPCTTNCAVVPEPDAWALMILGFGGVGGVLRTRRWRLA